MDKWRIIIIIVMMTIGMNASAQYKEYHGDGPDDVLRLVPIASAVALKACGVESRSNWHAFLANVALSNITAAGVTYGLKHSVHHMRPDGTDNKGFPSGHASIAFAGAHVMFKEFKNTSIWIPIAGYAVATATAIDRVHRNRHKWDDVAAGALIGVASTELSYWITSKLMPNNERGTIALSPTSFTFRYNL